MRRFGKTFLRAFRLWIADNAFMHSAAVSFYTLFSLAPITLIALGIAGFFLGPKAASGELAAQLTQLVGSGSAKLVQKAVVAVEPHGKGWAPTALGVVLVFFGATTVFRQLQDSLNAIWGVASRPNRNGLRVYLVRRLVSFAMALTIGFLLLVSLILSTALQAVARIAKIRAFSVPWELRGIDAVVSIAVIAVLFALVFKVLPDVELEWGDVWRAAFMTSLFFGAGRLLIAVYLVHSTVASAYGAAGSLAALLVWVYYSCAIMLFGVEVTRSDHLSRGRPVVPKSGAVLVRRELIVEPLPPVR